MADLFETSRLPGVSPVRAMIQAGDFNLFTKREHKTTAKKQPGVFEGSDLHGQHWQPTSSGRKLEPLSSRVFLNDYVYPDHDGKLKRKPRPKFFIGNASSKSKRAVIAFDGHERNDTASTANLASDL